MKKKTLLSSMGLGLSLALLGGAFGGFVTAANTAQEVGATAGTVTLSKGVFTAAAGSAKAYITWAETYWTVVQNQGQSVTAPAVGYVSAPRVYRGNYLLFTAPSGVTFDSISLTALSGYLGSEVTCGAGTDVQGDTAKPTTNANIVVTTAGTTLTTASLNSATSVWIQNGYQASSTNVQLRLSSITINYTSSITNVDPTGVSVALTSSTLTELGTTTQATATVSPANATNKSVTWSSTDTSVAVVSSTGVVTAISNGTASIKATSAAITTISGSTTVTVNAPAASVYDKTLSALPTAAPTNWGGPLNGYGTGTYYWANNGVSYSSNSVGTMSGVIQGQKTNGILLNTSAYPADIKKITITLNAAGTFPATLAVGPDTDTIDTALTPTVDGAVNTFTPSGSFQFFKISAPTATLYMTSIVVELVDSTVEAARTWAASFLTATASCDATGVAMNVTPSQWTTLNTSYTALSAAAKLAFTSDPRLAAATDIQKSLARYAYIVGKYGTTNYANFMGLTISGASKVSSVIASNGTVIAVSTIAVMGILTVAGLFLIRKKHNA